MPIPYMFVYRISVHDALLTMSDIVFGFSVRAIKLFPSPGSHSASNPVCMRRTTPGSITNGRDMGSPLPKPPGSSCIGYGLPVFVLEDISDKDMAGLNADNQSAHSYLKKVVSVIDNHSWLFRNMACQALSLYH